MGSVDEVKVYGSRGSAFSCRVETALKLKGIPYEYINEDLANKSAALLHYNPLYKKVPVLVHNGEPIAESMMIVEYIDETWKANPIHSHDPYDRATARFFAKFVDETVFESLRKAYWSFGEERDTAVEEAHENLKILEEQLKAGKRFFGGDKIGFVDIAASLVAHWPFVIQEVVGVELITEDKYPTLCKWAQEFKACPSVKDTLPSREWLLPKFKARLHTLTASSR